ncbi:MAG TPA: DUF4384 domain-containing protein [Acidobacteriota bacterium]|nr:DUF4384 domain-containing protein [Acidobacteriota bacterium]
MLKSVLVCIVVLGSLVAWQPATWAFQKGADQVRGSFLSTRPNKITTNPKPKKTALKKKTSGTAESGSTGATTSSHQLAISTPGTAVGLGYTLFMKGPNNQPVRVDPSRAFVTDDAIRLLLEPNIDGFLYIFHTEENKNPQLLFPDPRLQAGSNAVRAHVPYEVPSSTDSNQSNHWFVFEGDPATERLLIIIARQPITGIPIGQELVQQYVGHETDFKWSPNETLWAKMRDERTGAQIATTMNANKMRTKAEQTSLTRSLGLPKSAPPPSVILMNQSADKENLVTEVDLTHK